MMRWPERLRKPQGAPASNATGSETAVGIVSHEGRRARTGDAHDHRPSIPRRHILPLRFRRSLRRRLAARQTRGGRDVQRTAGAHRRGLESRYCRRPHSRRGDRDCAARQTGGARRLWLARQGGGRRHDHRHHLQHRFHDQADDDGRRADALRARPTADRRSPVEIFSEIRRHEGRRARCQWRADGRNGAGQSADHDPGPDAPHLRDRLWRPRQYAGAQNVSGRQRRRLARI